MRYSNLRNALSQNKIDTKTLQYNNFCGSYNNLSSINNILPNRNQWFFWKQRHGQYPPGHADKRGGIRAFFIHWLEKKERNTEKREQEIKERTQHLTIHGNALLAQFRKFDAEDIMVNGASCRQYIGSCPSGRQLLEHFYTGHKEMYNLLDVDETLFQAQLNDLLLGNETFVMILQGACKQCLKYHDKKDIPQLEQRLSELPP